MSGGTEYDATPARLRSCLLGLAIAGIGVAGCGGDDTKVGADQATVDDATAATRTTRPMDAAPRPGREEHGVFSLVDNRVLAHTYRGGALWIDGGGPGFAKYARFGMPKRKWRFGQDRESERVALARGKSDVYFSLDEAARDALTHIRVRVHAKRRGTLSLRLNGKRLERRKVGEGWTEVTVSTPAGLAVAGVNVLRFAGVRVGVASIRIGGKPKPDPGTPPRPFTDDAIVLADGESVAYYVHVPEAAHLVANVAPTGCRVRVAVHGHDSELEGVLRGAGARVDLGDVKDQVVRMRLSAAGCARATVSRPALTVPGPSPSVAERGPPPKHIILWVWDTLRADRVKPFNPKARAEVPNYERLAKTGTVFNPYWVQGNESQTSHASLFTGVYPVTHNVRTAGVGGTWRLNRRLHTIGKEIDKRGMYGMGVTANGYVRSFAGYGRGLDFWHNVMRDKSIEKRPRGYVPGKLVVDRALEKFDPNKNGSTFLFIGTVDAHKPYIGHEPWLSRYDPGPYRGDFKKDVRAWMLKIPVGVMECKWKPPKRDIQRINAIYDSDISYQDKLLGRLLARLDELGIADETMIILTADHGEEFWEHDICGHGNTSREVLFHVPLLIHYPPMFPGGVSRGGIEGVDVLPTIIDALGGPPNPRLQGTSLIPVAHGVGTGYVRPSYASQYEYAHSMRVGDWKMRVGSRSMRMWNLRDDYFEHRDLVNERPVERQFLTDVMSTFLVYRARWNKHTWGVATNMTAAGAAALEADPRRGLPKRR